MKLNKTLWAAVAKNNTGIRISKNNLFWIIGGTRRSVKTYLSDFCYRQDDFNIIQVRIIPVKGEKKR